MNTVPCKAGRHELLQTIDDVTVALRCRRCPIVVTVTALRAAQRSPRGAEQAVRDAERDWYIAELES